MSDLAPETRRRLEAAAKLLDARQIDDAERSLIAVLASAPRHAEALRLMGGVCAARGQIADAYRYLDRARTSAPSDAHVLHDLARLFLRAGRIDEAIEALRATVAAAPGHFAAWLDLGTALQARGSSTEARSALERAIALQPDHALARVKLADALAFLGEVDAAAAGYRDAIRRNPRCGAAWWGLAGLKTRPFDPAEIERLEALRAEALLHETDRIPIEFALGHVYEAQGRHEDAFAMLVDANARMRRRIRWDAKDFQARVERLLAAFERPEPPLDPDLGHEVVFIVSLPRAGSTLTEQILAAHSEIEGASELTDLGAVIGEESSRRRRSFPEWVGEASREDWRRLGERYLERTRRWRLDRPRFTDKMPNNWLYLGAALAMLPGARVVDCRRDPVETSWSCFKQLFSEGAVFSYDLADIAVYWRAYDRAMRHWSTLYPGRIRAQVYERLLDDPDAEIRALLEFCGLPFEASCRDFHRARRDVRTASAAQVREPLRRDTARTAGYGHLLDPLRAALSA